MPVTVNRIDYGTVNANSVYIWNADALETEDEYKRDDKILEKNVTMRIKSK